MRYLLLLALAGCANYAWYKPGATDRSLKIEQAQCNEKANSISGAGIIQRDAVFENCMLGKGWELKRI